jgi:hypothetical protein
LRYEGSGWYPDGRYSVVRSRVGDSDKGWREGNALHSVSRTRGGEAPKASCLNIFYIAGIPDSKKIVFYSGLLGVIGDVGLWVVACHIDGVELDMTVFVNRGMCFDRGFFHVCIYALYPCRLWVVQANQTLCFRTFFEVLAWSIFCPTIAGLCSQMLVDLERVF